MNSQQIFNVIKPGALTTFQDLGRTGYQKYGVPVSGAMDKYALQVANILVGNPRDSVCLEVTLMGPTLEATAEHPITLAITGAGLKPMLNKQPIDMWKTFRMKRGDRLSFGGHVTGVRAYIAVAGGFDAPSFFKSQSADVNSGFGHALKENDDIYGYPAEAASGVGLTTPPTYEKSIEVSVVEGPHSDMFTDEGRAKFFNTVHTVEANSNRMGYRLNSVKIEQKPGSTDIWSDAVPFGGIQIPNNGSPIILMADRQTTGGYPRIGTVISSDLPKVAQLVPKGEIRFKPISVEEAQYRAIAMEESLYRLEKLRIN
ncbi:biotin-dependent carboxyltransferase family protein [Virgibacillus kekensis]|uniref:Biotin-dependent carboxyltransferase family protein n=1 Tax=Virgibacillus kekensis TaxID=202261 RepID=A0ABV9DFL0_9BACI